MSTTVSDITVETMDGKQKQLSEYAGNVLLIVNVASFCGYTPQYSGLENLNQKYRDAGLRVLGFPCNDFGAQEPGTNDEIAQFCETSYGVTFEMFDKVHAKGSQQHPLYAKLTQAVEPSGDVAWNFEKFLVNRQGEVVARFKSAVKPDSPELISAIEQALAQ
ncbi:glutathione peroxidase [Desertifilum sp. FACHB-1129]|uniref:Glutathione peroxidase n=3 Tax=Cyanophyceae TaxID=3028117 RepID=A0A1E5QML5_9CYAN|nr:MULTISPECIES: glutathione peroxidase [Cyanophyceae]MCD8489032.1 glutathione peroxidase [Desertifilum sp.]MDA0212790.1 glutathione peroxidase [Cyanobacteria bacterium FC1]MDI9640740.1 glutathione peroxidase [Geitlerinema splendidum]MDK3156528.1 glutathione peroxidase [Kamptonema cortianum]MBD2313400.1 glutathione peroxidase [Desertifilum sp. FACHB-1129]